ncbi:S26 family signal peptidase [Sphingomonas sp. CCH5-D11]|jgi:conjugative transfer signal peptidase TraF|uniref:S26 family signal peptidase n=1 Tax=Sphingomonas sp. CCH5-D11 TaxID=1768786 RepID=UPI000836B6F2|nr:S26 family signal peptidase [Sphingomonas sp. CCH5-D11]
MSALRLSRGRLTVFYLTALGAIAIAASAADVWPTRVLYNASASVPLGWYAVGEPKAIGPGDLVIVRAPIRAERVLVERGYIGAGIPLVKRVGAIPGSTVCRDDVRVSIDGTPAAVARVADAFGRPLPRWSGCRTLGPADVFLLNSGSPGSLDGRYFGPTPARDIIGKATPLWTW